MKSCAVCCSFHWQECQQTSPDVCWRVLVTRRFPSTQSYMCLLAWDGTVTPVCTKDQPYYRGKRGLILDQCLSKKLCPDMVLNLYCTMALHWHMENQRRIRAGNLPLSTLLLFWCLIATETISWISIALLCLLMASPWLGIVSCSLIRASLSPAQLTCKSQSDLGWNELIKYLTANWGSIKQK